MGFGAALLQTGKSGGKSQEKGGKDPEGISTLHSVHVKCLKSWACVSSNQPMASTTLPPDLVQNLPLGDFIWNCSPGKQGILAAECV